MSSWIVRRATSHDWPKIWQTLLTTADLPLAGAEAHLSDFFLAFRDDDLIGSAGLECYGDTALLRSVAVAVPERGHGLGQALVQQVLAYAASLEVRQVVLLTTTAADFFLRFGFRRSAEPRFPGPHRRPWSFRRHALPPLQRCPLSLKWCNTDGHLYSIGSPGGCSCHPGYLCTRLYVLAC